MSYLSLLRLAAPETLLVMTALVVLGADRLYLSELEPHVRVALGAMLASVGTLLAIGWTLAVPEFGSFLDGMLVLDPLRRVVRVGILVLAILTFIFSAGMQLNAAAPGQSNGVNRAQSEKPRGATLRPTTGALGTSHVGEYFALILLAAIGMLLLVSSEDILLIFVSLELTSLCLYVLAAFAKASLHSAEAGLKYFLLGSLSAAFTLFGLSLLYGIAHSTNLREIAAAIQGPHLDPLLVLAIVLVLAGFGFKVAAAPFHLWAPDVYEGAPLPSAAFIASGSKVAGFLVLAQVMVVGFKGAEGSGAWREFAPGWVAALAIVASVSMLVGNLAALVQTSVRRLLAYSAVAHAGYVLLAVIGLNQHALPALAYYALTYALTALGAFGVVAVVCERTGGDRLTDFAGLSRRDPVLAFCMAIFLLSLAGIPPLAGFFGKFYVFSSALMGPQRLGLVWVVALALALSAVSLYYYLKVLKQIYIAEATAPSENTGTTPLMTGLLVLAAAATLMLGVAPELLLRCLVVESP